MTRRELASRLLIATLLTLWSGSALAQPITPEFEVFGGEGDPYGMFERTLAMDGEVVAFGSPDESAGLWIRGVVDLYDARTGEHIRRVVSPDRDSRIGLSVAVADGLLATTARYTNNDQAEGAVLLYDISSGDLVRTIPIDFRAGFYTWPLAMRDGLLVVGSAFPRLGESSGLAYVFAVSTGEHLHTLVAPPGASGTYFGSSVAVEGGVALIGSPFEPLDLDLRGEVYAFDLATGDLIRRFPVPEREDQTNFGASVGLTAGVVAVGDARDSTHGPGSGAVCLFDLETGAFIRKIWPVDVDEEDSFGWYLSAGEGVIAAGSIWDDDLGDRSGSAYLFEARTGRQLAKLLPEDGRAGDWFGHGLAIAGGRVLVGAKLDTDEGDNVGSVYQFRLPAACAADLSEPFEKLNFFDISAYLTMWHRGESAADFAPPFGTLNFDDVAEFLEVYLAGCP